MFKSRYRYAFIIALSAYSFLNIVLTVDEKLFNFDINKTYIFVAVLTIILIVWELNRFISTLLNYEKSKKWKPLIFHFLFSLPVVVVAMLIALALISLLSDEQVFQQENLIYASALGFRVNLFLHCINSIFFFLNRAKRAELQVEKFNNSSLMSRHEALKTQLNPHFLFNSLNALSELIHKDVKQSSLFIDRLSRVYRYFLISNERSLVSIKEELTFIDSYLFLLKTRFDKGLKVEIQVDSELYQKQVVPAVLQVLVENAVKHNVIQESKPLKILIFSRKDRMIVENNLQRKSASGESTGMGLRYINEQYDFLGDDNLEIVESQDKFIVSIPILSDQI